MRKRPKPITRITKFFNRKLREKGDEMVDVLQDNFYLFLLIGIIVAFLIVLFMIFRGRNKRRREERIILHKRYEMPDDEDDKWDYEYRDPIKK